MARTQKWLTASCCLNAENLIAAPHCLIAYAGYVGRPSPAVVRCVLRRPWGQDSMNIRHGPLLALEYLEWQHCLGERIRGVSLHPTSQGREACASCCLGESSFAFCECLAKKASESCQYLGKTFLANEPTLGPKHLRLAAGLLGSPSGLPVASWWSPGRLLVVSLCSLGVSCLRVVSWCPAGGLLISWWSPDVVVVSWICSGGLLVVSWWSPGRCRWTKELLL